MIIYCHPWNGSFNHSVLQQIIANLKSHHQKFELIDLYKEHFDPAYDEEELRLFHEGKTHDPLVTKYLKMMQNADQVIFVTPIWWNGIPGMLKGFIDKVMKEGEGLSHIVTKTGIKGELTNIKKAYVFTSSTSPTLYYKYLAGNGIKKIFINQTLKQIGVKKARWINFGNMTHSKKEQREKYLNRIWKMNL